MQSTRNPPSTGMQTPVTNPEASLLARYSGPVQLPGLAESSEGSAPDHLLPARRELSRLLVDQQCPVLLAHEEPGAIAFTRMPFGANSFAAAMVRFSTPALAAS